MSVTIITNSGSTFLTNISSEQLIGKLCEMVGAKFFVDPVVSLPKMAYKMTKEEVDAIEYPLKTITVF